MVAGSRKYMANVITLPVGQMMASIPNIHRKDCCSARRSTDATLYHISARLVSLVGCLLLFLDTSCCKTGRKSLLDDTFEPADVSVTERGLVSEQVSYRSILRVRIPYKAMFHLNS